MDVERQELENLWRKRAQDALHRWVLAKARTKQAKRDQRLSLPNGHPRPVLCALVEQSAAIANYRRTMETFNRLLARVDECNNWKMPRGND